MIIHTERVEQEVNAGTRVVLTKEVVITRLAGQRLVMVRKRLCPPVVPHGVVLLIHGFGQNRYTWHVPGRSFSAYLAAEGWDVYNVDLRGHGRSARIGTHALLLEEYVRDDLPAFATESLRLGGADKLFLVGHSMGGLLAYGAAASSLRDRVRGIVSIGSPYEYGRGSRVMSAAAMLLTAVRATGVMRQDSRLAVRLVGRHLRRRRALWDRPGLPMPIRAWVPGSVETEVLDEYLARAFDDASAQVALDVIRFGSGSAPYGSEFEKLDLPLLVIAGDADHLAPPVSVRPAYARSASTDKSYRSFPLGHIDLIVARQAPRTVWPLIASWLKER